VYVGGGLVSIVSISMGSVLVLWHASMVCGNIVAWLLQYVYLHAMSAYYILND
jgi:hypothetical protein